MKLSSRSRYAVSAMVELALDGEGGGIPIVELSKRYSISQSSMEQLFAGLRRRGLVKGRRGRSGGYKLGRSPDEISMAEIIAAVDTPVPEERPARDEQLPSEALWDQLSDRMYDFLDHISLSDLLRAGAAAPGEGGYAPRRYSESRPEVRPGMEGH